MFPDAVDCIASDNLWWSLPTRSLSATLIILYDTPTGPRVVLTVRSLRLKHYPGDTALPGGRAEKSEDWWTTALREAWEEIGFEPSNFSFTRITALPAHLSAHFLLVRPVVCHVGPRQHTGQAKDSYVTLQDLAPRLCGDEVACAYSLPLDWFLYRKNLTNRKVIVSEWLDNPWYFYRFKTERVDDGWIFADPEQRSSFSGTTVVGLTAHILVDVARYFYGKDPRFEHFATLGNGAAVKSALKNDLFNGYGSKV